MKSQVAFLLAYALGHLPLIVGVCLTGLGALLGSNAVRRRRVALAIFHAYSIAQDVDAEAPTATGKKLEAALGAADEWMRAHGWRPLKPGEQAVATLTFKSMDNQPTAVVSAPK